MPLAVGDVDATGLGVHLGDGVPLVEEPPLGHDVDLRVPGAAPAFLDECGIDDRVVEVAAGGVEERVFLIGVRKAGADGAFSVDEQLAEVPFVRSDALEIHLPDTVIAFGPFAGNLQAAAPDDPGTGGGFPCDREFFRAGILRAEFERRTQGIGAFGKYDVDRLRQSFGNELANLVPRGMRRGQTGSRLSPRCGRCRMERRGSPRLSHDRTAK